MTRILTIIALALFMPTSAMAGQITMQCTKSVYMGLVVSNTIRYSEGIFYDTIELRADGLWEEPKFGDLDKNVRISEQSVAWEWPPQKEDKKIFAKRTFLLDFYKGFYRITKLTSPDGTDGSWRRDDSDLYNCSIIK